MIQKINWLNIANKNNRFIVQLMNISVGTLLCGQFGFRVAAYFINGIRPSFPFWATLYICSMIICAIYLFKQKKLLYIRYIFFVYIIIYSLIYSDGNYQYFKNITIYCAIPYICGTIIGKYISNIFFKIILIYSLIYIAVIALQFQINPHVFYSDRLFIFEPKGWDRYGGDPTGIYLGFNFGCSLIIISSLFFSSKLRIKIILNYFYTAIILFILLSYCSRSAIIGSYIGLIFIYICQIFIDKKIDLKKLLFIIACSLLIIFNITNQRAQFLSQISDHWKNLNYLITTDEIKKDYSQLIEAKGLIVLEVKNSKKYSDSRLEAESIHCIKNCDSVGARIVLYREAVRIFFTSPITGVGPGGYAKLYCGDYDTFASPHSLFLQVLAEYGLIGFVLLIINLIMLPISFIRHQRSRIAILKLSKVRLLIAMWLFFLINELLSGNIYYGYHFFLISGILISIIYNLRDYKNE